MKTQRHYFISDDLDDLEVFEEQLEAAGISTPQIHVLSRDDSDVASHHHLHEVQSFMKNDIVHSAVLGAMIGLIAAALVLCIAYFVGWTATVAGWTPFVFLAIVALGFCTWEGGLIGIEKPNYHFARFEQALLEGKHVFLVDLEHDQEAVLEKVLKSHPQAAPAGTEPSRYQWLVNFMNDKTWVQHS